MMAPHSVVVAHTETMVAEGIAAALSRYPWLLPIATPTTAAEVEEWADRAEIVVLSQDMPEAAEAAARLRERGVRVVFLGERGEGGEESLRVSTRASIEVLASVLVPAAPRGEVTRSLTRREQEILALVARGLAGKQVARQLGISPKTVEQHKTRIYEKLGVPNQTAAVCLALLAAGSFGALAPAGPANGRGAR